MTRKKIGLILMIAGHAITLFLISSILIQDMYVWGNDLNAFARKYDSFYYMIATRENGAFIISIAAGSLLFFPGLFLRFAPKSSNLIETNAPKSSAYTRNHREIM
jgi:hypothetical protein